MQPTSFREAARDCLPDLHERVTLVHIGLDPSNDDDHSELLSIGRRVWAAARKPRPKFPL